MFHRHLHLAFATLICIVQIFDISSGANIDKEASSTLQMISAIFRHGDRSPISTYPNDPHNNYKWPGGPGALSRKGALQHFNLGKKLRARYYKLLPEDGEYTIDNMYVVSSYRERCLMSAQSLLAGFMPPFEDENLLPIDWQPVPVSTTPRDMDNLLAQRRPCRKYDNLLKSLYENPPEDLKKMNKVNRDLYRILNKHTGKNISTSLDVKYLYDALLIEDMYGFKLPDWTKDIFPKRMIPFAERDNILLTETPFMKQVKGGPFVTEVFNNMIQKREKTLEPNRKIFLYSAHDSTLVNIMNSLNIVDQTTRLPEYASMLILELHTNPNLGKDLEVKLFYYPNSEAHFPKEVHLPKCSHPCSLSQFGEINKHLMFDNFDEICDNS